MNWTKDAHRKVFDIIREGVYFVDTDRRIIAWNKAAEEISGFTAEEAEGSFCMDNLLNHIDEEGRTLCRSLCPLAATLRDGREREAFIYLHHKEGFRVPVLTRVVPVRDARGRILGAVETFMDAAEQAAAPKREGPHGAAAMVDGLTGLGNRRYMETVLQTRLEEVKRYGRSLGLLILDIDHFKQINESHGQETGERILKMVSATVLNSLRPFNILGRWAEGAFAAAVLEAPGPELKWIGKRIRVLVEQSCLDRFSDPVHVTLSVGGAVARPGDTFHTLIERARKMVAECKEAGQNRVFIETEPETEKEPIRMKR